MGEPRRQSAGGCLEIAERVVDRVSLVSDDVIAQAVEQFGAEIIFLILVLAGKAQNIVQQLGGLGVELIQGGFQGLPAFGNIQAHAAELDRIGGDKGRGGGIFCLGGEDFEQAAPAGFRIAHKELNVQAVRGVAIGDGSGSQAGEAQSGQGAIGGDGAGED